MTAQPVPSKARIVYDEERRGWVIEVGPRATALLGEHRLIETEEEAEQLLRLRGYELQSADGHEWPWRRLDNQATPGSGPCVNDWARNEAARILPFEGDDR